jgi:hypothetical protein
LSIEAHGAPAAKSMLALVEAIRPSEVGGPELLRGLSRKLPPLARAFGYLKAGELDTRNTVGRVR